MESMIQTQQEISGRSLSSQIVLSDTNSIELFHALEDLQKKSLNYIESLFSMLRRNTITLLDCPVKFNGVYGQEDIHQFLNYVEAYKNTKDISDAQALKELPYLLIEHAAWWWSLRKDEIKTWQDALDRLRKQFSIAKSTHLLYKEIYEKSYDNVGSVEKFIKEKLEALAQLPKPQPSESTKLDIIYTTLSTSLKCKFKVCDCKNIEDLIQKACLPIIENTEQHPETRENDSTDQNVMEQIQENSATSTSEIQKGNLLPTVLSTEEPNQLLQKGSTFRNSTEKVQEHTEMSTSEIQDEETLIKPLVDPLEEHRKPQKTDSTVQNKLERLQKFNAMSTSLIQKPTVDFMMNVDVKEEEFIDESSEIQTTNWDNSSISRIGSKELNEIDSILDTLHKVKSDESLEHCETFEQNLFTNNSNENFKINLTALPEQSTNNPQHLNCNNNSNNITTWADNRNSSVSLKTEMDNINANEQNKRITTHNCIGTNFCTPELTQIISQQKSLSSSSINGKGLQNTKSAPREIVSHSEKIDILNIALNDCNENSGTSINSISENLALLKTNNVSNIVSSNFNENIVSPVSTNINISALDHISRNNYANINVVANTVSENIPPHYLSNSTSSSASDNSPSAGFVANVPKLSFNRSSSSSESSVTNMCSPVFWNNNNTLFSSGKILNVSNTAFCSTADLNITSSLTNSNMNALNYNELSRTAKEKYGILVANSLSSSFSGKRLTYNYSEQSFNGKSMPLHNFESTGEKHLQAVNSNPSKVLCSKISHYQTTSTDVESNLYVPSKDDNTTSVNNTSASLSKTHDSCLKIVRKNKRKISQKGKREGFQKFRKVQSIRTTDRIRTKN